MQRILLFLLCSSIFPLLSFHRTFTKIPLLKILELSTLETNYIVPTSRVLKECYNGIHHQHEQLAKSSKDCSQAKEKVRQSLLELEAAYHHREKDLRRYEWFADQFASKGLFHTTVDDVIKEFNLDDDNSIEIKLLAYYQELINKK